MALVRGPRSDPFKAYSRASARDGVADDGMAGKLHDFESFLRRSVHDALASVSEEWWDRLVPKDVKSRAKQILQKRSSSGTPPGSIIDCLGFSDYSKIIDGNWDNVFEKIFKDRDTTRHRLAGLTSIGKMIRI